MQEFSPGSENEAMPNMCEGQLSNQQTIAMTV